MHGYVIIEKATNRCCQTIKSPIKGWRVDNDNHFSMTVPAQGIEKHLDKYFYNGMWWERVWNEEKTEYTDIPFTEGEE